MDKPVNIAGLSLTEALTRARRGGRAIFTNEDAVAPVFNDLWLSWSNANMPKGLPDDEFSELAEKCIEEFQAGVDEAIQQARYDVQPVAALDLVTDMLNDESAAAWQLFNVLAFMAEAIPDDDRDGLPVKCTLINLREGVEKLATNLMDLVHNAKVETGGADHA
jgi:hypothetical protein